MRQTKVVILALAGLFLLSWSLSFGAVALDLRAAESDLIVSELMAANGRTLADEDGDYVDWIEIHNAGDADANLRRWYLTDNWNNRAKWRFPEVVLPAGGYLVVFASGKDRAVAGSELHTNFRLDSIGEYLALVRPNGKTLAWERDLTGVAQFEDVSFGLDGALNERYFTYPTPGASNGAFSADLGPLLSQVGHAPFVPTEDRSMAVTAHVRRSLAPVGEITLHYRVLFGDTHSISMYDDGRHGDGAAEDGLYGAYIPHAAYGAGEMVRYYVTAADAQGRASRWPLFNDPLNSPEYLGTVIADPEVDSLLPTLYWFSKDIAAAGRPGGTRASMFYEDRAGEVRAFYDNVFVRVRGFSSRSRPKKHYRFDLNQGYHFSFSPHEAPVEEFNLNSTYTDKAQMRQVLAWETYREAGVPYSISFPVRVHLNNAFYGLFIYVEGVNPPYLARQGLDPEGVLYEMDFCALDRITETVQKQTHLEEDDGDLRALVDALNLDPSQRAKFLFDRVDIPAIINYQATATILHDRDQGHNNYYLYRDPEGKDEWMFLPWDKDLTFGINFEDWLELEIKADQDPDSHPLNCYKANDLIDALLDYPPTREMFLRRLRTLMDELLEAPGTPIEKRYYERRIEQLYTQMQLAAALDAARWPSIQGLSQTFGQAVRDLQRNYLDVRRVHLYETHGVSNGGIIPGAQPVTATVEFGPIGLVVSPRDLNREYLTLVNPNAYAVDLSGWQIEGGIEYTFAPGVVLPAGDMLYLSPDVVAFRHRPSSPTGGEGRFVQGNYQGWLSETVGIVHLIDDKGRQVDSRFFMGLSWLSRWPVAVGAVLLLALVLAYARFLTLSP
jgi:hypothetical protein